MFTKRQLEQIHQGKCEGVNVEVYLDPEINEIDMWLVRKTLLQSPDLEELVKQFVLNKEVTKHMKDYKVYQGLWAVSCLKNEPIEVITLAFQPGMTGNNVTEYVENALNKISSRGHQKKLMTRLRDDQFSNTAEQFDSVRDLKVSELLDPFKTSESLERPKALIKVLESLCNKNIVRRYNSQNENLPNRISIVDARKRVLIELINHPNTIRKLAFKHLNDRLGTSQPRSKERKVLRHFKQEIQPYVDKMIDIYDNLQIYIDAPFNQRLTDEMIDALNKDLENGNNNEKRRIIDEVSIAIKEIEQLSQSIHDAYQDMLIHAYSTES